MTRKIFIAGSGGIGQAVALLLSESRDFDSEIYLGDISEANLIKAKNFIIENCDKTTNIETVLMPEEGTSNQMTSAFEKCEVLLDCSPGGLAPKMARYAMHFKMHYANLTEFVAETDEIITLAGNAETGFILQTGLAPGFINVLAMSLYKKFVDNYQNERVERIGMKVGALTAHAHEPHFYGFTWSPIGVATEYVKKSRVIRDYKIEELPALSAREQIIIGARNYEADLTSGGAADLPEYFEGKARNLDYKTLRYVGHYSWVDSIIAELPKDENLPNNLQDKMLKEIPSVEDDLVLVHASVDGYDAEGSRRMVEKAYFVEPMKLKSGKHLRAIQTTTAAPLCESAMMLLQGKIKGVHLQSQISPEEFMNGKFVSNIYKDN